ncbi:MAG: LuxR family transcriptional regulator [Solirubrobacterales bacterium]|nr:LuxR family transcriptional regulator [Solirubrobacterales bacterium]
MSSAVRLDRTRARLETLACAGIDSFEFREQALIELRRVIPHDYGMLWTTDPATGFFTSAMPNSTVDDPDMVYCRMSHRNEFVEPDFNKFRVLARLPRHVGVLSQATGADLGRSARYRTMLQPLGFEHELRLALVDSSMCWGAVMLWRAADSPDFTEDDQTAAAQLGPSLASGLRVAMIVGAGETGWTPDGPGLILLDDGYAIRSMTPGAQRWLAELDPSPLGLPEPVVAVAASLANDASGSAPTWLTPWARVRGRAGRWIMIHGSRTQHAEGGEASTAIIIEEAKAAEIAPIIVSAYRLSEREAEVTRLILHGLSTKEIAAEMYLSAYTVQDYLKAIFDKVGVRSRRQLAARLYEEHYWPSYGRGELHPDTTGAPTAFRDDDGAETERPRGE